MSRKIGGLSDIKTGRKANIRSMPKARNDYHLDLYILTKTKARLEQEKLALDKRKRNLEANLKDVRKKIKRIERGAARKEIYMEGGKTRPRTPAPECLNRGFLSGKRPAESRLKTIVLNY